MARGRKKKPEEQRQNEKITVWLTEAEKHKLTERTGNMAVSQYFRELLLRGRAPKLPPIIPEVNLQVYKNLSEHHTTLKQLSEQFAAHSHNEQALALANHAEKIRTILENYRISLISLSPRKKGHDCENQQG